MKTSLQPRQRDTVSLRSLLVKYAKPERLARAKPKQILDVPTPYGCLQTVKHVNSAHTFNRALYNRRGQSTSVGCRSWLPFCSTVRNTTVAWRLGVDRRRYTTSFSLVMRTFTIAGRQLRRRNNASTASSLGRTPTINLNMLLNQSHMQWSEPSQRAGSTTINTSRNVKIFSGLRSTFVSMYSSGHYRFSCIPRYIYTDAQSNGKQIVRNIHTPSRFDHYLHWHHLTVITHMIYLTWPYGCFVTRAVGRRRVLHSDYYCEKALPPLADHNVWNKKKTNKQWFHFKGHFKAARPDLNRAQSYLL